ncbi:MAG: hypothetical protein A3K67_06155 [Euryarchaeota archaeon RBG_16_62_10]|nr:MAG: hypothetical protein A3K67_06155 [Euryarchaeota archaeon RBG_16_62_10]
MKLIAVDGLDGCGKNSHASRIKSLLEDRGARVFVVSHPSSRLFGRLSKRSLEASGPLARAFATAFFTADVLASVSWLRRQKSDGYAVFVRYLLGTAYLPRRLAPLGYGLFRRLLPSPDLALFVDIDPRVALRRIHARGDRMEMFETLHKLDQVRSVAKSIAKDGWVTVDNSIDGEGPFAEVGRIVAERFEAAEPVSASRP